MQLPAVQERQSMPEALLRQQHGSWERTRRAKRPQPDGGDAHRAMLPDHARCPPQGRAATRVRWPCSQRRSGYHHLRRYPPQACRRCADHHPPERGAGTRPAQGPARATESIAKKSTTGSLPPAVPLAITPTFSPWMHTSDDSYIYQLSLVLATAKMGPPILSNVGSSLVNITKLQSWSACRRRIVPRSAYQGDLTTSEVTVVQ